ncbi:hypothetical protein [Anaerosporobacter sp.]
MYRQEYTLDSCYIKEGGGYSMFSVELTQLSKCSQKIMDYEKYLEIGIEDMEQCKSNLRSLSGMSGIIEQMQSLGIQLEQEKKGFEQLAHTLNEIIKYYEHCEKQIEDRYERGKIVYQKLEVKFKDLDTISSFFEKLENR